MRRLALAAAAACVAVVLAGTALAAPTPRAPRAAIEPPRIAVGVTVGNVAVGGLSPYGAWLAVRRSFARPLEVVAGTKAQRVAPGTLGARAYFDGALKRALNAPAGAKIPLRVTVHGSELRAWVRALGERLDRKPIDAVLVLRGNRPFVSEGVEGRRLDRLATAAALAAALAAGVREPVTAPVRALPQRVSRLDFGQVLVIKRDSKRLELYDGMRLERTFGVAVGQPAYPTPVGRFNVVVKWRNPWWYPPSSAWAQGLDPVPPGPGNPLGTRWMGLSAPGVGIHGTPNDGSIGYSLSHGCIRMHIPEAEWLFEHVDVGTPVFIVSA